jgi:hypothetical protein
MEHSVLAVFPETPISERHAIQPVNHAHSSGVTWGAVIGGAFVTASLSLILLSLGVGFGLSSISPWAHTGASASAIGTATIAWLIAMQLIASSMGGYLAGRLRVKWVSLHTDEVYFRDTAHGFLSWAVAVVMTAAFLASAAATMVGDAAGGGAQTAASVSAGSGSNDYFVDMLFRPSPSVASAEQAGAPVNLPPSSQSSPDGSDLAARVEASGIFANALSQNDIPAGDRTYLDQLISARTGLGQADADQRVSNVLAQARQSADTARKAAAHASFWIFMALLVGAFSASVAATIGGAQRDNVVMV